MNVFDTGFHVRDGSDDFGGLIGDGRRLSVIIGLLLEGECLDDRWHASTIHGFDFS